MLGEALGITDIRIDYRYCEHLNEMFYLENPIPQTSLRAKGLAELKASAGTEQYNFTDNEASFAQANTLFPENEDQGKARVRQNFEA